MRIDAPFSELPVAFQALQTILLGDREMVDVLALVLFHDEQTVVYNRFMPKLTDRPA